MVKKVTSQMPPDEMLYDLAELFKSFGDTTRIKILYALFEAELCVCDMAQLLGLRQTCLLYTSQQKKFMKSMKNFPSVMRTDYA